MPKDIAAQIAKIKEQEEKLARRKSILEQQAKSEDRKRDTRRKIIVGGAVLDRMTKDETFAASIRALLAQSVGRPNDKEVIADLLPPPSPTAPAPSSYERTTWHQAAIQQIRKDKEEKILITENDF